MNSVLRTGHPLAADKTHEFHVSCLGHRLISTLSGGCYSDTAANPSAGPDSVAEAGIFCMQARNPHCSRVAHVRYCVILNAVKNLTYESEIPRPPEVDSE